MRAARVGLLVFLVAGVCTALQAAKKKPCAQSLETCPERGCAKEDSTDALINILKNNLHPEGEVKLLDFKDFMNLQRQAEKLFKGKYSTLTRPDRARLRHLKIGNVNVGEGHLVEILGYIAQGPGKSKPHANTSGESVNCRLPKNENNDFHISLTPRSDGSEYEGIVVEMIPHGRNDNWTLARLRAVQRGHYMVRVQGQLLFDNHHKVNDDPKHEPGNQPKRMSLWEVHPVTEFDVCKKTSCKADGDGWDPLEKWEGGKNQ